MSNAARVTRVSTLFHERVVALSLHWGDRLVSLEHVAPGQRPYLATEAVVTWTSDAPSLSTQGSPLRPISPDDEVSVPLASGLTLKARLRNREVAPEALEPSGEQLFAFRVFAFATLGLIAVIAMMVVTPVVEDDDSSFFRGAAPGPSAHYVQPIPVMKKVMDAAKAPIDPGRQGERQSPKQTAAPATGKRDARAAARSLLDEMMGGTALKIATAGLGSGLDEALHNLGPSAPGADASGLSGLGSRGTGPGAATSGLGIGGVGSVGGHLGRGLPGLMGGHRSVVIACDLTGGSVGDGLSREEVLRVVRRHQSEIRFCYESALQRQPSLSGKVSVRWVIAPSGEVAVAEISEATLDSVDVQACMLARVRRWRFPSHGSGQVVVTFPWVFRLAGEGEVAEQGAGPDRAQPGHAE
ncbi:MAG: AgmX/PglI C-terminal domain-containing protein [Myxococcota bacterium]